MSVASTSLARKTKPEHVVVDDEIAAYNPISAFAAAFRTLFGNPLALPAHPSWPIQHPVLSSLLCCAGLLATATPLMLWRYRARTTR